MLALKLSLVFLVFGATADYLEENKVRFLDWTHGQSFTNYLFRGNEPKLTNETGDDYFAYDELQDYMINAASNLSVVLPKKYWLIDYKLYYVEPIEPDVDLETQFFQSNPTLGELRLQRIIGDLTSPRIYPQSYVKDEAIVLSSWQPDNLPDFIQNLNKLLYTEGPNKLPMVIYVHCECGCDRTGEVAGSYAMQYMGMTFNEAYAWDEDIAGRWILPNHKWAMEWFCSYLQYAKGFNVDPCWLPFPL